MQTVKRLPPNAGIGRGPALPLKPGMKKIAKRLTRKAWRALRTGSVPDTQVARAAEVNRMTVQSFRTEERPRDDMSLKLFLAAINETGGDPAQVIADTLNAAGSTEAS